MTVASALYYLLHHEPCVLQRHKVPEAGLAQRTPFSPHGGEMLLPKGLLPQKEKQPGSVLQHPLQLPSPGPHGWGLTSALH